MDASSLDDNREERAGFMRGLVGGIVLGFVGVFLGGMGAAVGIYSSFSAGDISAASAGTGFGLLGLVVGVTCAAIGCTYNWARTRAAQ